MGTTVPHQGTIRDVVDPSSLAVGSAHWAARAAAALRETLGVPLPTVDLAEVEQAVATTRAALGEEAWMVAFAAGRALSLEQAIAEALGEVDASA